MSEEKNYALAASGGAATVLNINNEINLFGSYTNLAGTNFDTYGMINDNPVVMPEEKEEGSWWGNLLTGVAVTAVLAGLAIATVATGGAALVAVGLAGAAVGTGVITAGVSISDAKSGHARTWGEFVGALVLGGIVGATTGAMLYGLWAAIPAASAAIGLQAGMLTGVNTFTAVTLPKIAAASGYALMGSNAMIGLNEINQIGTGRNVMVDTFFDGNNQAYDDFVIANSMLSMGYVELARSNPALGSRGGNEVIDPERAKQKKIIDEVESGETKPKGILQEGNYGEMKMDDSYESRGYTRMSKDRVTSLDAATHQGIDGVYYKKGPPEEYIIAEAKYTNKEIPYLRITDNNRQMSDEWILAKNRLRNAVGEEIMNKMLVAGYERNLVKIDYSGNVTIFNLDNKGLIIK